MGCANSGSQAVVKARAADTGSSRIYGGGDIPVFMLAPLSKGETANLSKSERNQLKAIVSGIADDYREGLKVKMASKRRT